jgi:high-affinity iron transporter
MTAPILQAFVITLREGLEAFLIVAISLAYLRKSGRHALTRAVYTGIVVALGLSAIGGYLLYNASNQEWLEGPLAVIAAASVAWMVVHMWRAGRFMKRDIEGHLSASSVRVGAGAFAGVLLFTVLMITREGIETAVLLLQLKETVNLAAGAVAGLFGASAIAWLWSRFGHRVNLALFFQVTAIFLFVFVVQLLVQGVHEMSEQGYLPFSEPIHLATEEWGPESRFGHMLTYLLVIAPMAWLVLAGAIAGRKPSPPSSSRPRMEEQTALR